MNNRNSRSSSLEAMETPMAPRDRIIIAATAEFAQYGIAGARIERIARAARTSKERLYAYFRSKESLYSAVIEQELTAIADATRLDPTDLPGYAGRVHDYFLVHPDRFRLVSWGQLELDQGVDETRDDPLHVSIRHKVEQLRQAQADGYLDPQWDPADILTFVTQLAVSWADQAPTDDEGTKTDLLAHRRAAIVTAVQRLFPSTAHHTR